jgi:hypothetical protein
LVRRVSASSQATIARVTAGLCCSIRTGYHGKWWIAMLSALIGVLIIVVIGAICFWAIDKFANDRRLAQLLKLLVILICIAAILQRVLPLLGIYI